MQSFLGMVNVGNAHHEEHSNVAQPFNFLHEDGFVFVWDRVGPGRACRDMVSYPPLVQRIQAVGSSQLMCH
jgi:hypothetical protein